MVNNETWEFESQTTAQCEYSHINLSIHAPWIYLLLCWQWRSYCSAVCGLNELKTGNPAGRIISTTTYTHLLVLVITDFALSLCSSFPLNPVSLSSLSCRRNCKIIWLNETPLFYLSIFYLCIRYTPETTFIYIVNLIPRTRRGQWLALSLVLFLNRRFLWSVLELPTNNHTQKNL